MKAMKQLVTKLVRDEQGGELMEYALIAGLIVVAAITAVTTLGGKIKSRFEDVNTGLTSSGS